MPSLDEKAIENFRSYLQIPSVHPDINYDDCVTFLKSQADELGLPCRVVSIISGKPVVLITWEGLKNKLPAIMLNSHMDVVPVFEESWNYPPFGACMDENGNIYARGAQDTKCLGIMYLEAIRRLKEDGIRLDRTLHVSFVPDEEIGGQEGMKVFVKSNEFQDLNIGFVMDEGVPQSSNDYILFHAEKIIWQFRVHCLGKPGHGSSLQGNTAGEKFRYIINQFLNYRIKMQEENNYNPFSSKITSVNLTQVYGGVQVNVIPEELTAAFDLRIAVDEDLVKFEEMLLQWCKDAGSDVTIEYIQKEEQGGITAVDDSNPYWTAFKKATDKLNITVNPIICPATTDGRYIRKIGIPVFGFTPVNKTTTLAHDHNEYLNKDQLINGIKIFYEIFQHIGNCK